MTNKQKDLAAMKALILAEFDRSLAMQTLIPGCFEQGAVTSQWINKQGLWLFVVRIKRNVYITFEQTFTCDELPEILRATKPKGE